MGKSRGLSFGKREEERTESVGLRIEAVLKRDSVVSAGSGSGQRTRAMAEDSMKGLVRTKEDVGGRRVGCEEPRK